MVAGAQNINPRTGSIASHCKDYSPREDKFRVDTCISHVARKADFKDLGNRLFVRKGWKSWMRERIEGNSANDRYHRAAYESSQRISAALWASAYRAGSAAGGDPQIDLSDDSLVKARFYRQDNLRFTREFQNPQYGLSRRNRCAAKLSRWAHCANGVTELGAAPTGMLLKFSKLASMPKRDEKSLFSQLRVCAVLPFVAAAVAGVSAVVHGLGIKKATDFVDALIRTEIHSLVGSFSALSAASAAISLMCGATSCMVTQQSKLSPNVMKRLQANQDKHLHRLYLLIKEVKDKPNAAHILSVALKKKIPAQFCDGSGQPVLLNRLMQDLKRASGEAQAKQAMQHTLGAYLTECGEGEGTSRELLDRENHVVALTNLIEHVRVEKDPSNNLNDIRTRGDSLVENQLRPLMAKGAAGAMGLLGFNQAARNARRWGSDSFSDQRNKDLKDSHKAPAMHLCADHILNNPHQYGPLTRTLANLSEGLRVVNHGIVMSLNYQLTRPFAALSGRITEGVFGIPNSRVTSFSIGRFIASSAWAVIDSFLFLSLAAGNGIPTSGVEASTKVTFPLQIPLGAISLPISIISTAAQMTLIAIPSTLLMWAAQGAACLEGWKGDIRPTCISSSGKSREIFRWDSSVGN